MDVRPASAKSSETVEACGKESVVTVLWFLVWLVCNLVGDHEPLRLDPLNWWAATLVLAVGLDLNRPHAAGRRK